MRNTELFGWCPGHGLQVVQLMTLMTVGLYKEPAGAYLPSVLYRASRTVTATRCTALFS